MESPPNRLAVTGYSDCFHPSISCIRRCNVLSVRHRSFNFRRFHLSLRVLCDCIPLTQPMGLIPVNNQAPINWYSTFHVPG